MELSKDDLANIAEIFRKVEYGKITFLLSPERDYLQCLIEESQRIPIQKDEEILQKTA